MCEDVATVGVAIVEVGKLKKVVWVEAEGTCATVGNCICREVYGASNMEVEGVVNGETTIAGLILVHPDRRWLCSLIVMAAFGLYKMHIWSTRYQLHTRKTSHEPCYHLFGKWVWLEASLHKV